MTHEELVNKTHDELVQYAEELQEQNEEITKESGRKSEMWFNEYNEHCKTKDELNTYRNAVKYGMLILKKD